MAGFLLRLLVSALALWLASAVVPGISVQSVWTLLLAALFLGIVNAVIRPIVFILTLPITVVTLGLFLLVINAGMLALVAYFLPGFQIAGFWSAVLGALIVSITSWVASWFIGPRGRVEVMHRRA